MTNPDNMGGLPEPNGAIKEFCAGMENWRRAEDLMTYVRAYGRECFEAGELCRAAPAGGDDGAAEKWCICRSCMVIVRLPADTPLPGRCQCSPSSWSLTRLRIPKGYELRREASADVERCDSCDGTGLLHRADGMYVGECHCVYSAPAGSGEVAKALEVVEAYGKLYGQLSGHTIVTDLLNDYAALLRKLQQGADYEPAFWNVRKDGKHLILFPLNGAVTITAYLEMVAGANPGSAIDAETLYRAASPGKEAFNG